MSKISQPYVILEQSPIHTKVKSANNTITKITLIGVNDRCLYKTYIDPTNYNYKNWSHITSNPKHGFVVRNIKVKDAEAFILNADSKPIIEWEHDNADIIMEQLKEIWVEQDDTRPKTTFRDLFE